MATPLIRIPQEQGGTLYAFSSSARDLTRSYYNPDLNFEFSKFALVKVPVMTAPAQGSTNNYIQFNKLFDASGAAYDDTTLNSNANIHFAQTFQNYALNLEQLVLNDDDFDSAIFSSDAEKIFFKYLNRIGAFQARTATSQEAVGSLSRMVELDDSALTGAEYERVIKYLGNIDVSNDKNYKGDVYNEIFINVPSAVGYTPNVLLKSATYNTNALQYVPGSFIEGRAGQTHPDINLNLESITDNANSEIIIDPNESGIVENALGIDFNASSYAKIVNDAQMSSLFDYSKRGGDFTFNAILVYYDLYSKSTPTNRSTNLYGVLILDNFKEDPNGSGWFIPTQTKYKPNDITGLNGNAFSLKLNVKFNSSMDNVGVENNINDFSTFGMDIFLDTVSALSNATKLLKDADTKYTEMFARVADIESLILTSADIADVKNRISQVEKDVANAKLNMSQSNTLLALIQSTNLKINQMLDGTVPTSVQYNIDVIKPGPGINIDKSTSNIIKITNTVDGYEICEPYLFDVTPVSFLNWVVSSKIETIAPFDPTLANNYAIWSRLKPYTNRIAIDVNSSNAAVNDVNIYIDDTATTWKKGQVVKIKFNNTINMAGFNVKIWSLKSSTLGWTLISTLSSSNFITTKPYVELICTDAVNKQFELDILR